MKTKSKNSRKKAPEQPGLEGIPAAPAVTLLTRVSAVGVRIVYPFMAKRDIRFYLNGINIRPLKDGVMLVATDGHRFVVLRDATGTTDKEVIAAVNKDGLKHTTEEGATFDVLSDGSARILDKTGGSLFIQPGRSLIDAGDFPRIENVVSFDGYKEGIGDSVNPAFLADALLLGKEFGGIKFYTRDPDSPLLFVFDGLQDMECFGGIMKRRDSFESLPAWFPKRGAPTKLSEL